MPPDAEGGIHPCPRNRRTLLEFSSPNAYLDISYMEKVIFIHAPGTAVPFPNPPHRRHPSTHFMLIVLRNPYGGIEPFDQLYITYPSRLRTEMPRSIPEKVSPYIRPRTGLPISPAQKVLAPCTCLGLLALLLVSSLAPPPGGSTPSPSHRARIVLGSKVAQPCQRTYIFRPKASVILLPALVPTGWPRSVSSTCGCFLPGQPNRRPERHLAPLYVSHRA